MEKLKSLAYVLPLLLLVQITVLHAQEEPRESVVKDPYSAFWQGNYANFRLNEKLIWHGELHLRATNYGNTPFIGRLGKIYNRHGLKYLVNDRFTTTVGPVLRLNFTPEPGNEEYRSMVLEPRIWHQYQFVQPFDRFMVYHRFRFEHRWSRDNLKGADWIFRNRWRYKFQVKYPLNEEKLSPGAYYLSPDVELILQSGKPVAGSPLENLRLYPHIGYIQSPKLTYSLGMMYSTGQELEAGYRYSTRWVLRFNFYWSIDLRDRDR